MGLVGVALCGRQVQLLVRGMRIEDAVLAPAHSRRFPQSLGFCTRDGHKLPGLVYAVLDNPDQGPVDSTKYAVDDTVHLTPTAAWRIDVQARKLTPLALATLKCARFDIFTVDGGR